MRVLDASRDREITVAIVTPQWERFGELIECSFVVLYEPIGLTRPDVAAGEADWRLPPAGTDVAVALDASGAILGSAWLLPAFPDGSRQVRQVAVDAGARGTGVGAALMRELERFAAAQGVRELWLQSRDTAYGFYGRLGYEREGEGFVNERTQIPHWAMRKRLG